MEFSPRGFHPKGFHPNITPNITPIDVIKKKVHLVEHF